VRSTNLLDNSIGNSASSCATPKRKVKAKLREDRVPATAHNEYWSMDFLSDQLFDGRKIRVLSIVDNFTRLSPALDVRFSYRGSDVVDTLERIAARYGRCVKRRPLGLAWLPLLRGSPVLFSFMRAKHASFVLALGKLGRTLPTLHT